MTAVRKVITTILLYLLTSQEKAYSDVLLKENSEDLTCNESGEEMYKYNGYFFEPTDKGHEDEVTSDGGIFTCEEHKTNPTTPGNVSCKSHTMSIFLPILENVTPTVMKRKVGKNVSFPNQFTDTGSFTLLWIFKRENLSKCIFSAAVIKTVEYFGSEVNKLCCSTDDIKDNEKVLFRNQTSLSESNQNFHLELVNVTISDSGEYTCIKNFHDKNKQKWEILNKYSLEVTGDEDPLTTPAFIHNEATTNLCCGVPTERNDKE
ncbi:uncharacterized protein [Ranitomeya imitator]|uniref:uncharacterized protein n=1 Tax=Ranitomeya imitator TaxID=111125 RepID=UPI0037E7D5BD